MVALIKAKNLNKYFFRRKKNEIHVINDVSLELPEKGLIALFGPSGGGKTTLLNVIGGLDKASGTIYYNDQNYSNYNMRKWDHMRTHDIGYIFQNYLLINELSVYENIKMTLEMIGIKDQKLIDERIDYVLESVGLKNYKRRRAGQLSGGQQQRVAIARAFAKNPKVIIADEPTGNLDSRNTVEIMNIIKKISQDKLVLLVTHEPNIANHYADRILKIEDGKITSDQTNDRSEAQAFTHQSDIFLEDLEKTTLNNEHVNIELYGEFDMPTIKLVNKDGTIYIDLGLDKKVVIIDSNSETKLISGKKEDIVHSDETTFDYDKHFEKPTHKSKFSFITIKRSIKLAFNQIFNASRKRKMLLIGFLLSGVLIAVMTTLFTLTFDSKNKQFYYPKEQLDLSSYQTFNLSDTLKADEALIYQTRPILTYKGILFDQLGGTKPSAGLEFIPAHILKATIILGRDIKDDPAFKEITIDKPVAQKLLNAQSGYLKSLGYELKDLINLEVSVDGIDYTITGITEFNYEMSRINYDNAKIHYSKTQKKVDIEGKTDQELIMMYDEGAFTDIHKVLFTKTPKATTTRLTEQNIVVLNDYELEYKTFLQSRNQLINTFLIVILVVSALIWLSLYFIIRSNLFSRIDEIKVYRALGVRRFEIVKIFLVEVIVLTTLTTLVGFSITMYFIINNNVFNQVNFVLYTPLYITLAVLFMYVFNIIFGTLPVFSLLRKTPAAIMAQAEA